jgi:hypothetical protein
VRPGILQAIGRDWPSFRIGFEGTEQVDDLLKRTADAIAFLKA